MSEENDKSHDKVWFIRKSGKTFGPFAAAKIRNFLIEGKLDLRDEVSRDKKNWRFLLGQPEVVPLQMRDPVAFAEADASLTDELDPGSKGSLWIPIVLIVVITIGGIIASLQMDESEIQSIPDCTALPAPGLNWNSCNKRTFHSENATLDRLTATNVNLQAAKMAGSSFKQANLRYAQFEKADLAYADFSGASLKGADFHGADLSHAILDEADLRYADLTSANLGGASLANALLDGAVWINGSPCKTGSTGKCIQ